MSGEILSENGVKNRNDIIIKPNYYLIGSMVFLLLFGTAFTMWLVSYCMRKGWSIPQLRGSNYRSLNMGINIHHQNHRLFTDRNDFQIFKSESLNYEEDDLDGLNMDIQ
jgi:hypothetical protein